MTGVVRLLDKAFKSYKYTQWFRMTQKHEKITWRHQKGKYKVLLNKIAPFYNKYQKKYSETNNQWD